MWPWARVLTRVVWVGGYLVSRLKIKLTVQKEVMNGAVLQEVSCGTVRASDQKTLPSLLSKIRTLRPAGLALTHLCWPATLLTAMSYA